jgi:hypothetical protein
MFGLALAADELPDTDTLNILKPSIDGCPVPPYLGGDIVRADSPAVQAPSLLID